MNVTGGLERVRSGELLYTDEVGHDACGIGGVAARDGKPSAEVLRKALTALKVHGAPRRRLRRRRRRGRPHRQHPAGVLQGRGEAAQARRRPLPQARGHASPSASFFFFDTDPAQIDAGRGARPRGARRRPGPVPRLPPGADARRRAAADGPAHAGPAAIEQVVLLRSTATPATAERWLYRRRLELRERFRAAGLDAYIPSLSARLVSYKGLLTSPQLADYYPDLPNPAFETGIAIFHRRYSTNTYPNWTLAQPFRFTCHNGEINTDPHQPQRRPRLRPRPEAAAARRRPAHAEDERLGQPRRVGRVPDARAGLEPAARAAAVDPAGVGHRGRRLGPGRGRPVHLLPPDVRQPARVGRPGRHHRHRRPRRWSGWSTAWACGRCAGVRDKRGWLYIGQRVRRLRPRHHHHRRQRAAPAGADDRPRHRDRRAARQPPDHGAASWPRRRPNSATSTS